MEKKKKKKEDFEDVLVKWWSWHGIRKEWCQRWNNKQAEEKQRISSEICFEGVCGFYFLGKKKCLDWVEIAIGIAFCDLAAFPHLSVRLGSRWRGYKFRWKAWKKWEKASEKECSPGFPISSCLFCFRWKEKSNTFLVERGKIFFFSLDGGENDFMIPKVWDFGYFSSARQLQIISKLTKSRKMFTWSRGTLADPKREITFTATCDVFSVHLFLTFRTREKSGLASKQSKKKHSFLSSLW